MSDNIHSIEIGPLSDGEENAAAKAFGTPKDLEDTVKRLAAGNIGAFRVCSDLASAGQTSALERMDALGLSGPSIWIVYKDLGDETYETLVKNLEAADLKERLAALGY